MTGRRSGHAFRSSSSRRIAASCSGAALALAASLLAPSCTVLEPRPDQTRWFVLATIEELDPAREAAPRTEQTLGVGPLTLPEYVLRRELVSRRGATSIVPSPHETWAEPLDEAVARVLASDLAFSSGARTVLFPWFTTEAPRTRVRIDFARFELEDRARAVLVATWRLEEPEGGVVLERQSQFERELADPGGASAALELSHALAELCDEIAEVWKGSAGPE